jgi:phage-related protein
MEEPQVPPYRIRFYATDDGREPVREWLHELPRDVMRWVGFMIKEHLQAFGPDVCKTTFGKNLGGGLYEFRLKEDELPTSEGPRDVLYRIFFAAYGDQLILLVHAYDKGEHPQGSYQERMIQIARQRLRDFRERNRS